MSNYSPSLRIELITTGDQAGTWGTTTNTNLGTLLEDAISGYTSVSITSANQALTALNGAADQSRNQSIALTTTTTAPFNVYAPPAEKTYIIYNTSAYAATIYNSTVIGNTTAAGVGVAIPAGKTVAVWSDGTNFRVQNNHLPALSLTTDLAVADGGTGASTAADARTNLDVPSRGGSGASGTWGINISGSAASASSASSVAWTNVSGRPTALSSFTNDTGYITSGGRAYPRRSDGGDLNFYWSGQSGQPTWLWGGTDGTNMYVYNPSNFNVNYANSAGSASSATYASYPSSGGSFITSSNIGSQSVNYANSSNSANYASNAGTVNSLPTGQVLNAIAGASAGAVGTYACLQGNGVTSGFGGLVSGAYLQPSVSDQRQVGWTGWNPLNYGTWRCMGVLQISNPYSDGSVTIWLRVS